MFYSWPEELTSLGVNMYMRHDVLWIDTNAKELRIRNLKSNKESSETYDILVITTGSWPIIPKFKGMDFDNIQLCKNYSHAQTFIEKAKHANFIAVIGAGYIGIELVEAFEQLGKHVTLIDNMNRILYKYLDSEITDIPEKTLSEQPNFVESRRDSSNKHSFGLYPK